MSGRQFAAGIGVVAIALALGGIYAVVRPTSAHGGPNLPASITVLGTGTIAATPDRARFSFGVNTQRQTATAASSATAVRIQKVINALLAQGVVKSDIQTQGIWISPNYDGGSFDGYTASNAVLANIRNLDTAGKVIDAATAAGATQVYGPNLFRSDRQTLGRSALQAAMADARAKAQSIASQAGGNLGRVISVVEAGAVAPSGSVVGTTTTGSTTTGSTGVTSVPQPVLAGQQEIDASVSVTFATS